MKKISLRKWEYAGRKLANPFVILKRLLCFVILLAIIVPPLYMVMAIGWRFSAANSILEGLT